MVDWMAMEVRVRHHAANTEGFIPANYVEHVHLNGHPAILVMNMGLDLSSEEGQDQVAFHMALYYFCQQRCDAGLGLVPYQPAPPHGVNPLLPEPNPEAEPDGEEEDDEAIEPGADGMKDGQEDPGYGNAPAG
jgi:hypothetical protein